MTNKELNKILRKHEMWIDDEGGECANLSGVDLHGINLRCTNLHGIDLSGADLSGADLSDTNLSDANLYNVNLGNADLSGANLNYADLSDANLNYAKLNCADLRSADLSGADLRGADLDDASFTFRYTSLDVNIDDRQAIQQLYYLVYNVLYSKNTSDEVKKILGKKDVINLANKFHGVGEEEYKEINF